MKKESVFLFILRLALTLLIITGAVAAALAGVNAITRDRIAAIKAEKTALAISQVLPGGETAGTIQFTDDTGLIQTIYQNENGYAIEVVPTGFGGGITMMVGISPEGQVLGISVVSHTETAGLGSIAADQTSKGEAFRAQFQGTSGILAVTKDGGTIEAISGATITSRAVAEGVNAALAWVAQNG